MPEFKFKMAKCLTIIVDKSHIHRWFFVRLTGFFIIFAIGKEKKDLGYSRPKTIRNGQLCFEWD
jgi:hypothetical protein